MNTIYKFHFHGGRGGTLHGLFIADSEELGKLVKSGYHLRFGEVLGKHSEVSGPIEAQDFTKISDEPFDVEQVRRLQLEVGYDPLRTYARNLASDEEQLRS